MFRLSQLCTPPSTQTPESFKRRSACAARSNVLVSAAAQHGEGEALRHRRRACAALRGSAAGVPARDERRGHSQRRTPTPVFIKKVDEMASDWEEKAESAMHKLKEFADLGYPAQERVRACRVLARERDWQVWMMAATLQKHM